MTNRELLEGLARQDKKTIDYIYSELGKKIIGTLMRRYGCRRDEAVEALQEAIIKLLPKLAGLLADKHPNIEGWLYLAAENALRNLRKKDKRQHGDIESTDAHNKMLDLANSEPTDDEAWAILLKDNRLDCIAKILHEWANKPCVYLIVSYYYHKRTLKDLAKELGELQGTVQLQIHRCRKKLEKLVDVCVKARQVPLSNF